MSILSCSVGIVFIEMSLSPSSSLSYLFPEALLCCLLGCWYILCSAPSIFTFSSLYVGSPLCSVLLASSMTLFVHGPPSSCCMATVDPKGKESESVSIIALNIFTLTGVKGFMWSIIIRTCGGPLAKSSWKKSHICGGPHFKVPITDVHEKIISYMWGPISRLPSLSYKVTTYHVRYGGTISHWQLQGSHIQIILYTWGDPVTKFPHTI